MSSGEQTSSWPQYALLAQVRLASNDLTCRAIAKPSGPRTFAYRTFWNNLAVRTSVVQVGLLCHLANRAYWNTHYFIAQNVTLGENILPCSILPLFAKLLIKTCFPPRGDNGKR